MLQRPSHKCISKVKLSPYKSRITEWPAPPASQRQNASIDTTHVRCPISTAVLSNRTHSKFLSQSRMPARDQTATLSQR